MEFVHWDDWFRQNYGLENKKSFVCENLPPCLLAVLLLYITHCTQFLKSPMKSTAYEINNFSHKNPGKSCFTPSGPFLYNEINLRGFS